MNAKGTARELIAPRQSAVAWLTEGAVLLAVGALLVALCSSCAAPRQPGAPSEPSRTVLSALGGGQSCTSTEQCPRSEYCAVTARRGHMECREVAR